MITKIKTYILLTLIATGILTSSCSDFLETSPEGDLEKEKLFENRNSFQDLLNGCYSKLKNENFLGGLASIALPDIMSDNLLYSQDNNGNQIHFYKWTFNSNTSEVDKIWLAGFSVIQSTNELIEKRELILNSLKLETANSILAQAYTIRALAHFHLHRFFSDTKTELSIPYKKSNKISEPKRNSKTEVLEFCLNDLEEARKLKIINRENFFLSQESIYFLKMQIELEKKNYAKVIQNADSVLLTKNQLSSGDDFKNIWTTDNGKELIFRIHFTETDKPQNAWLLYNTRTSKPTWLVDSSLIKIYDSKDIRLSSYFEKTATHHYGLQKYRGRIGEDMPNGNDIKLMRLSEVYLSKAEALAQKKANKTQVLEILNQIRTNRGLTKLTALANPIEEVKQERRREFVCEGKRFFDLKRWGESITRLSEIESKRLDIGDFHWTLPIPINEIYANENMIQNDKF